MAYNTRNYWDFGLFPSSGVLKQTRKHNVSESGYISVLRCGVWTIILLGLLERANLNQCTRPSPQQENRCTFGNVVFSSVFFLEYRAIDKVQTPSSSEPWDGPTQPQFSAVFLGPGAHAELLLRVYVANIHSFRPPPPRQYKNSDRSKDNTKIIHSVRNRVNFPLLSASFHNALSSLQPTSTRRVSVHCAGTFKAEHLFCGVKKGGDIPPLFHVFSRHSA
jgi:hypothetical protein